MADSLRENQNEKLTICFAKKFQMNISKQKLLDEMNTRWIRDCNCALRDAATQAVLGNGNAEAEILFIGEAPGEKEDERGIPFVGSAGKFLDELLASISLKRDDVYITNVVKYRPPENRDPLPDEVAACREWLVEEIRTINPKLIVTLGRHAMAHFLPGKKISAVHGQVFPENITGLRTKKVLPLYHPAAALYNGGLRVTLFQDFKKILKIIKK